MRRLFTGSPLAVSAVSKLMFGLPCSSSTSFATTTPFALRQGPLPIRSRAFTAACPSAPAVLRYARHVFPPAFASFASAWQRASAPVRPPRSPPLPGLVARKKLMPESCPCAAPPTAIAATHSALRSFRFMIALLHTVRVTDSFYPHCSDGPRYTKMLQNTAHGAPR